VFTFNHHDRNHPRQRIAVMQQRSLRPAVARALAHREARSREIYV